MASRVEELLVRMGQAGQIRGQVTDEAMKGLLQQVSWHDGFR
jgi:programmed cell death protein 5